MIDELNPEPIGIYKYETRLRGIVDGELNTNACLVESRSSCRVLSVVEKFHREVMKSESVATPLLNKNKISVAQ